MFSAGRKEGRGLKNPSGVQKPIRYASFSIPAFLRRAFDDFQNAALILSSAK
jgi:hypothetical protein